MAEIETFFKEDTIVVLSDYFLDSMVNRVCDEMSGLDAWLWDQNICISDVYIMFLIYFYYRRSEMIGNAVERRAKENFNNTSDPVQHIDISKRFHDMFDEEWRDTIVHVFKEEEEHGIRFLSKLLQVFLIEVQFTFHLPFVLSLACLRNIC